MSRKARRSGWPGLGWPLLQKELLERAARRRTHITRVLYGGAFLAVFLLYLWRQMERAGPGVEFLGSGRDLADFLLQVQFGGVYLLLPAMLAGAIAGERERGTLDLLRTTALGPLEIVLAKFLGGLVPMVSVLLLVLPPLGVAYAYGGVEAGQLWAGALVLAVLVLYVGAVAVFASAGSRSTTSAFVWSYLLLGALHVFLPCFSPAAMVLINEPEFSAGVLAGAAGSALTAVALLLLAGKLLGRRSMRRRRRVSRALHRTMSGIFDRLNEHAGGVVLVGARDPLPGEHPVAWLAARGGGLSNPSYMTRSVVWLLAPVALVAILVLFLGATGGQALAASALILLLWCLLSLLLTVTGSGLVVTERARGTLDVLLTTPLSGRRIVWEKVRSLRPLWLVLLLPLVALQLLELYWETDLRSLGTAKPYVYVVGCVVADVVYVGLLRWGSVAASLVTGRRAAALLLAVGGVLGWLVGPLLAAVLLEEVLAAPRLADFASSLSPAVFLLMLEYGGWDNVFTSMATHVVLYGGLLLLLRNWLLRRADRRLGRIAAPGSGGDETADAETRQVEEEPREAAVPEEGEEVDGDLRTRQAAEQR